MTSNGHAQNTLGPADLRLAGEAFEAALVEASESELHPYTIRKSLAQHVMQSILAGERDVMRICEGALASLRRLESVENVRVLPSSSNENNRPPFVAKA